MNPANKIDFIANQIIDYFINKKTYTLWEPIGLISDEFPDTFNPSATHTQVRKIVRSSKTVNPSKYLVIERCFRHLDLEKVGISNHLSFFEMLGSAIFNSSTKAEVIKDLTFFIENYLNINKEKLVVTVFGGWKVDEYNFAEDKETMEAWKSAGVNTIIKIPGKSNYLFSKKEYELGGPRTEVFIDRGDKFFENRYIEIATLEFANYITRHYKGSIRLIPWENSLIGFYFGLERINMIVEDKNSIYDIELFERLSQICYQYLSDKRIAWVFNNEIVKMLDHLISIIFILSEGQSIDQSTRGRRVRGLIKDMFENSKLIFAEDNYSDILKQLIDEIVLYYETRYPYLNTRKKKVFEIFSTYRNEL